MLGFVIGTLLAELCTKYIKCLMHVGTHTNLEYEKCALRPSGDVSGRATWEEKPTAGAVPKRCCSASASATI